MPTRLCPAKRSRNGMWVNLHICPKMPGVRKSLASHQ